MVNIQDLSDQELDSLGYNLYEKREQLTSDLQNTSNNIMMLRAEKITREKAKEDKKEAEKPKEKQQETTK